MGSDDPYHKHESESQKSIKEMVKEKHKRHKFSLRIF